jgi:hypothetical protein
MRHVVYLTRPLPFFFPVPKTFFLPSFNKAISFVPFMAEGGAFARVLIVSHANEPCDCSSFKKHLLVSKNTSKKGGCYEGETFPTPSMSSVTFFLVLPVRNINWFLGLLF